jgi:hypothetical protein
MMWRKEVRAKPGQLGAGTFRGRDTVKLEREQSHSKKGRSFIQKKKLTKRSVLRDERGDELKRKEGDERGEEDASFVREAQPGRSAAETAERRARKETRRYMCTV